MVCYMCLELCEIRCTERSVVLLYLGDETLEGGGGISIWGCGGAKVGDSGGVREDGDSSLSLGVG